MATMIRRFYVLPLRAGVPDAAVSEFLTVLSAADRFIPGLRDSSAALDLASPTVLWENTFVDEASYSGPYMVHPFHIGAIDDFLMADSPACITQDIFTVRHQTPDATQPLRSGIRRVLLLNVDTEADAAAIESLAAAPDAMAASAFGADDVGWVSAKGRAWTHVWEQAFTDRAQLDRYLTTRDGLACSSVEGFGRLGIAVRSLRILTCPFELRPAEQQSPAPMPSDDGPVRYSITARCAADDADRYCELLERLYDPFMADNGGRLLDRVRTVGHGYLESEVRSTWELGSLADYSDLRARTYADPGWKAFVRDAMPMVVGGSRRFDRPVPAAP
jgi:hypothetical protein